MPFTPEALMAAGGALAVIAAGFVFVLTRRRSATRRAPQSSAPPSRTSAAAAAPTKKATLHESLTKTRHGLLGRLQSVWGPGKDVEARLAALEEILLTADVGLKTTQRLLAALRPYARELGDPEALRTALREQLVSALTTGETTPPAVKPCVVVVAGVNGVGKTTSIAKLAYRYRQEGKKVLLVAADTFRAAASEQLAHWAQRVGVDCVRHQSGADPSAVAFDGLKAATKRGIDVVIIDTAGRLHVKQHLIEELKKIVRVIGRELPGAPHEVLLVIDATTGQNAITQARVFQDALSLTGIILTKLDGTAKGGAVFAVHTEVGVPIRYVGIGEGLEDLQRFDAASFVDALLAAD